MTAIANSLPETKGTVSKYRSINVDTEMYYLARLVAAKRGGVPMTEAATDGLRHWIGADMEWAKKARANHAAESHPRSKRQNRPAKNPRSA